jgi:Polysaccharide lyase
VRDAGERVAVSRRAPRPKSSPAERRAILNTHSLTLLIFACTLLVGCNRPAASPGASGPDPAQPATVPASMTGAPATRSADGLRLPLFDGFESDAVAGFWLPGTYGSGLYVPGAVATSADYARTGRRSVRITVHEGDIAQPGDDGHSTERAELDAGYFPFLGRDVWYGFSFLVPPGFPVVDDRLVISSCKQRNVGTALIAHRYVNGRHSLTVWDPRVRRNRHYDLPDIPPGVWNDMTFHVRFSAGDDGMVQAWAAGKLAANYTGPTADPKGENLFYNKIGLYRDRLAQPMTIYFDNYTLGESREAVDPGRFDRGR